MTLIITALIVGIIIGAAAMAWFLPLALNDDTRSMD